MLLQDLGATVICSTAKYGAELVKAAKAANLKPGDLKLRIGTFGRDPWTDQERLALEEGLHLRALNNYGLSEMTGPGVAAECHLRSGMHIAEDHFLAEIVDPVSFEPVPPGTRGELVMTALTKDASPILRYRTRDLTVLDLEPCPCGRTMARIGPIQGRTS